MTHKDRPSQKIPDNVTSKQRPATSTPGSRAIGGFCEVLFAMDTVSQLAKEVHGHFNLFN